MEAKESDTIKAVHNNYKYKSEYCQKLVEHLKKGLSVSTFGVHVGVTRSTVYEWIDTIPEFKEAHQMGLQLAQEFFESRLSAKISGQDIKGIDTRKIDTTALIFALKTRFHETYGDKVQVTTPENLTIKLAYNEDKD